jgi:hypothetical protein
LEDFDMSNYLVENRQFTHALLAAVTVDGVSVGASYAATGLDNGQHIATIKKAVNVHTIKWNKSFGLVPQFFIQAHTLDCVPRVTASDRQTVEVTLYTLAGAAGTGDEDYTLFVFGTDGIVEGGR